MSRTQKVTAAPDLRSTVMQLARWYSYRDVVDAMASLAAENAEHAEKRLRNPVLAEQWDVACGKLAVTANQIAV